MDAAPRPEIAPVAGATTTATVRFTWNADGRQIGTLDVVLRDRWRLAEGHATMTLPKLDCYPRRPSSGPVVLRRLPNRLGEHPARVSGEGIEFFGVREYVPATGSAASTGRPAPGADGCR